MKELFPHERVELLGFHPELVVVLDALNEGKAEEGRAILHQFFRRTLERLRELSPLAVALRRDLKPIFKELRELIELTKEPLGEGEEELLREAIVRASALSDEIGVLLLRVKEALDRKSRGGENPHIYTFYLYTFSVIKDLHGRGRNYERYLEVALNSLNVLYDSIERYVPVLVGLFKLSEAQKLPEVASELLRDLRVSFLGVRESLGKGAGFLERIISGDRGEVEGLVDELKSIYSELKERLVLFNAAVEDLDRFTRRLVPLNFLLTRILWLLYRYELRGAEWRQLLELLASTLDRLGEDVGVYREVVITPQAEADLERIEEALELSKEMVSQLKEEEGVEKPSEGVELIVELDEVISDSLRRLEGVRRYEEEVMSGLPGAVRVMLRLVERGLERTIPESVLIDMMMIIRRQLLTLYTLIESARVFLRVACEGLRTEVVRVLNAYSELQRSSSEGWRLRLWELLRGFMRLEEIESKECIEGIRLQEDGLRIKCPRCSTLNPISKEFCERCSLDLTSVGGEIVRGGIPEELVKVGIVLEGYLRGELPEEIVVSVLEEISAGLRKMAETERRYVPVLEAWEAVRSGLESDSLRELWENLVSRYTELTS